MLDNFEIIGRDRDFVHLSNRPGEPPDFTPDQRERMIRRGVKLLRIAPTVNRWGGKSELQMRLQLAREAGVPFKFPMTAISQRWLSLVIIGAAACMRYERDLQDQQRLVR